MANHTVVSRSKYPKPSATGAKSITNDPAAVAVSNLTLIVGGPGSGKTSEVVSRLAARYEADPFAETVVLVPTVRHGDQLRRRLVGRCGVALRLRVETIPQFSRQLAAAARVSRPPHPRHSRAGGNPSPAGKLRVPSYTLAGELLARTARREVERGPAAYFRPIAGTVGFNDLLSDLRRRPARGGGRPTGAVGVRRPVGLSGSDGAERHLRSLCRGARTAGLASPRADRARRGRRPA